MSAKISEEHPSLASPTISMRSIKQPEGGYVVEMIVSGLSNERQAEAAMAHLQRVLCGTQIASN